MFRWGKKPNKPYWVTPGDATAVSFCSINQSLQLPNSRGRFVLPWVATVLMGRRWKCLRQLPECNQILPSVLPVETWLFFMSWCVCYLDSHHLKHWFNGLIIDTHSFHWVFMEEFFSVQSQRKTVLRNAIAEGVQRHNSFWFTTLQSSLQVGYKSAEAVEQGSSDWSLVVGHIHILTEKLWNSRETLE